MVYSSQRSVHTSGFPDFFSLALALNIYKYRDCCNFSNHVDWHTTFIASRLALYPSLSCLCMNCVASIPIRMCWNVAEMNCVAIIACAYLQWCVCVRQGWIRAKWVSKEGWLKREKGLITCPENFHRSCQCFICAVQSRKKNMEMGNAVKLAINQLYFPVQL